MLFLSSFKTFPKYLSTVILNNYFLWKHWNFAVSESKISVLLYEIGCDMYYLLNFFENCTRNPHTPETSHKYYLIQNLKEKLSLPLCSNTWSCKQNGCIIYAHNCYCWQGRLWRNLFDGRNVQFRHQYCVYFAYQQRSYEVEWMHLFWTMPKKLDLSMSYKPHITSYASFKTTTKSAHIGKYPLPKQQWHSVPLALLGSKTELAKMLNKRHNNGMTLLMMTRDTHHAPASHPPTPEMSGLGCDAVI